MKIPYRPKTFIKPKRPYRYIILHDITCQFEGIPELKIDSPKFDSARLRLIDYLFKDHQDLNYHFVVEKIGDDYETIVGRPISAMCQFDDIISPFDMSIHICMMGDFSKQLPDERYYKQLAYRAIAPMMRTFRISRNRVLLHREVSEHSDCPGSLFNRDKLLAALKIMVVPQ